MNMESHIVAIDLGSSFIKGAVAQKDEQGRLKILAVEKEPSVGVRNGVVYNPSEAAARVKSIVTKLQNRLRPIEFSKVYVGLNGHTIKTIENNIPFSFQEDKELTENILDELCEQNNSYGNSETSIYEIFAQEFLLDGELEAEPLNCMAKSGQANYKLVLGKAQIKERIFQTMERISLDIAGIFIAPVTTAEVMVSNADKELGCAVIDFGGETTSICVYADNFIRHVAVIPFGGKTITKDIMNLRVPETKAEELKIEHGCALVAMQNTDDSITLPPTDYRAEEITVSFKKMAQIIEARMNEIADFICIEIDKSGYYSQLRNGLIITGGGSALDGIAELLNMKSGFDVRFGSHEHLLAGNVAENDEETEKNEKEFICENNALLAGLLHFGTEDCKGEKPKIVETLKRQKGKSWLRKMGDGIVRNLFEDRE